MVKLLNPVLPVQKRGMHPKSSGELSKTSAQDTKMCMWLYLFCHMYTDLPQNLSSSRFQDMTFSITCFCFGLHSPFLLRNQWWVPQASPPLGNKVWILILLKGYLSLPLSERLFNVFLPQKREIPSLFSLLLFLFCLTQSLYIVIYLLHCLCGVGKANLTQLSS